jgi:hypothetical protein
MPQIRTSFSRVKGADNIIERESHVDIFYYAIDPGDFLNGGISSVRAVAAMVAM